VLLLCAFYFFVLGFVSTSFMCFLLFPCSMLSTCVLSYEHAPETAVVRAAVPPKNGVYIFGSDAVGAYCASASASTPR
jgi:hypothetical protein